MDFGIAVCNTDSLSFSLSNWAENSDASLQIWAAKDARTDRLYKLCRIYTRDLCRAISNTAR